MNIHRFYHWFSSHFRGRRNALFHKIMRPQPMDSILDVGGYPEFWNTMNCSSRITCLNLDLSKNFYSTSTLSYVQGDGRCLPFGEKTFDIVFSNSVIEHVGDWNDQRKFAEQVRRVGKSYWVQTPNKWFFVEPHLLAIFVHYLPWGMQKNLIRYFTLWGLVTRPSQNQIGDFLQNTRLLTERELRQLFPEGTIYREKFFPFTKSFVVYNAAMRILSATA